MCIRDRMKQDLPQAEVMLTRHIQNVSVSTKTVCRQRLFCSPFPQLRGETAGGLAERDA